MNKKRSYLGLFLLAVLISASACSIRSIRGSGNLVTETRQVSDFDRIALSGSGEVILVQDGSESLTIETDDNVMKYVKAEVENGILKLGFENGINIISTTHLIFRVDVINLTGLNVSGSGEVVADRVETDDLEADISGSGRIRVAHLTASGVKVDISGSGEINLTGDVRAQDVMVNGSGKYLGGDLCRKSIKVNVRASGDATVRATESLDAKTSGSGSIGYYGQPAEVNTSVSGSGKINNLGGK